MENASKALLMAGGILLAILTLTGIVYLTKNITSFSKQKDQAEAMEQLEAFNKEYEAYNKKLMYGTDVITVVNKAEENNLKYNNSDYYNISITVEDENGKNIKTELLNYKVNIFECSKISYNNQSGRINSMTFIKLKIDDSVKE